MGEVTEDRLPPRFDPFSDEYFHDPTDLYRRMRDEAPVSFNEEYGFWAMFRYDEVRAAHLDWQTFTSTHGLDLSMLAMDPEVARMTGLMIMMDPPDHERARGLVGRVFTPRAVRELEPMVAGVIEDTLSPLDGADSFDAVADFAGPFPVEVICRMLGVPAGERQQIRHWLDLMLERRPGERDPTPEGIGAAIELWSYFLELVRVKRTRPGDDMISGLTRAEMARPDGRTTRLDDEEIAGFLSLLGGAGAETVTKLVANAVVLFHRNPDQYARVVADPGLIPDAVEEVLRILPPSQYQGRFSVRDSVVGGVPIPAGHPVLLVTGSATRDERAFDRPDEFDIGRTPNQALGFGFGIHTCLGAALARMESRLAIGALARRWPRLAVDESGCRRVQMSNVAGYSRVPVHAAP
jgi:cytochrome P450